jgi:hypothetical protein
MIRASLVTAAALALVAIPTPADAAPGAYCLVDAVADFSKGLGATSSSGTYTTKGTATCFEAGAIEPMGSGTYTSSGAFEGNCGSLTGDFVNRIELATAQGKKLLEDTGTFVVLGSGYSIGERSTGPFEVVGFDGDCVTTPFDNARFLAQFYLFG